MNSSNAPSSNAPSSNAPARNSVVPRRLAWTMWALIPVGLLAFHFGPGQRAWKEDRAAKIVARAESLQAGALKLQDTAYDAHLAAIEARIAAFGSTDESLRVAALEANKSEEAAYAEASAAWRETANALAEAEAVVEETGGSVRDEIRLARGRALVRTGDVAAGAAVLEDLLTELMDARAAESADSGAPRAVRTAASSDADALARATREELATAYYYGARLLRLGGQPAEQWREAASRAKQNFRYLAEEAKARGASGEEIANHEKNGELVLNLEQSSLDELYGKPRPKDSPTGNCNGLCDGKGKKPGKKPGGDKPSKGAGMNGEIGNGW